MHIAIRLLLVLVAALGVTSARAAEGKKPLKVAMYSGSKEYDSAGSLAKLKKVLEEQLGATCTLNIVEEKGTSLAGVDDLETADVAVFFTRRVSLAPDQLAKVKKFVESGKGVVGIRTASHGFQTWLEFDAKVLGGSYGNHYKLDAPADVVIEEKGKDHPVMAGVPAFKTVGKMYKNPRLADDVTLLLTAKAKEYSEPVAWAREAVAGERGRVFYTSLGVPGDFDDAAFQKLMMNAVRWTAR
ncbi:MAG TPA: ThuA domain-containing protein [Tepidisphaeraceae bacterium]|nr:ThuA domain-containing protein [Tepidisphaeraceae bacterium]